MNFLAKYKPKTSTEIIGNGKVVSTLLTDLETYKYKGCYLLSGQSGSGKTTIVDLVAKDKKWPIKNIGMNDINTRGETDANITCLFKRSIIKKIILIDDIDLATNISGLRNSTETRLKKLVEFINKDKFNLIFLVSTENKTAIFKKINKLKTYKFQKNRDTTLEKFAEKIFKKEGITLSEKTGNTILKKLVENSHSNVRKLVLDIEMFIQTNADTKSVKFSNKNKETLEGNKKDKSYKDIYDLMGNIFKTKNLNDKQEVLEKESVYYADSFLIPAVVFEHYAKGENCKDLDVLADAIDTIADGDELGRTMNATQDYSKMPFVNYNSYVIPTQLVGRVKTQMFFPANVSKNTKVNNNMKKLNGERGKNHDLFNYNNMDLGLIYQLQKLKKIKKKDEIISNTLAKSIFTIN